ncbi:MAG: hypothetical protein GY822_02875 [Deltaproteobacteria bacterium]|nr:hypothetical protein [Deltaproteobacteria bacterium]
MTKRKTIDPREEKGAENTLTRGPEHWCRKMRWKSYGVDQKDPLRVLDTFVSGGVTFNCLTTALPMGADDELASPEACASGRSCYEEHPQCARAKKRSSFEVA